jgi:general secretion pathway protein A
METFAYFGLSKPPFDGTPDPRFLCVLPSHSETLATLEYAVHSGKPCTLVLGDSGSGKTLLGQILAQRTATKGRVLWVHGFGQHAAGIHLTVCTPGSLAAGETLGPKGTAETPLTEWLGTLPPGRHATTLIVDDADGLPVPAWNDILALVTRQVRTPQPVCVVLLGLPDLIDTLGQPALLRLQRRVFRTCRLNPLNSADVATYIQHRLTAAGGTESEVFTPEAVELIHRFSDGNPALINQLCDNTMVDAFADERQVIDGPHVLATVSAITGGVRRQCYLPSPAPERISSAYIPPPEPDETLAPEEQTVQARLRSVARAAADMLAADPTDLASKIQRPVAGSLSDRLNSRLRTLDSRLSEAFSQIRAARERPSEKGVRNLFSAKEKVSDRSPSH